MLGDMLFTVPALTMASLWSKYGPVYFYLFDHGTQGCYILIIINLLQTSVVTLNYVYATGILNLAVKN
jgi:hypothetical protein